MSQSRTIQNVYDRSYFGRQWLQRGRDSHVVGDVFSAFFAGYIALICSATQLMADSSTTKKIQKRNDETWEREAIEQAFRMRASEIAELIRSDKGTRIVNSLRLREIPGDSRSKIIGSVGDSTFAEATGNLDAFWSPARTSQWSDDEVIEHAEACAYLLRRVRNRLFHGEKMNDPHGSDADLLDKLNPLLFEITEIVLVH
jgi:hypothetical protein